MGMLGSNVNEATGGAATRNVFDAVETAPRTSVTFRKAVTFPMAAYVRVTEGPVSFAMVPSPKLQSHRSGQPSGSTQPVSSNGGGDATNTYHGAVRKAAT